MAVNEFAERNGREDTVPVLERELYVIICVNHSQFATLKCCVVAAVHARYRLGSTVKDVTVAAAVYVASGNNHQ